MRRTDLNSEKLYIRGIGYVPVSHKTKEFYEKDCARIRMKAQRHGMCTCPRSKINQCNGDCLTCIFYRPEIEVESLSNQELQEDTTRAEFIAPIQLPTDIEAFRNIRKDIILQLIKQQSSDDQLVLVLMLLGESERDIARHLKIPRTTLAYRKNKLFEKIRTEHGGLSDLINL